MFNLFCFQPFPSEDGGRQATDSRGEYSHAKEHCERVGVKVPLVGLLTALGLVRSGSVLTVFSLCAGHVEQI